MAAWEVHLPSRSEETPAEVRESQELATVSQKKNVAEVPQPDTVPHDDFDHPDFNENSKWPRRLLNVRTMISHKWQPGNTYDGVSNPTYSILSYTWGRWRDKNPHSSIKSLDIEGVPWDIPRVDPKFFTVNEFKYILDQIVEDSGKVELEAVAPAPSPFIWLDIACIPQWRNSAVGDSEVGRQARIFRGARQAYIWLTTADRSAANTLLSRDSEDWDQDVARDIETFRNLLRDPWFTSMWTLQESYIQQKARIVTRTGLCKAGILHHKAGPLGLSELRGIGHYLAQEASHCSELEELLVEFKEMLYRVGFKDRFDFTPLQALECAQFRTSESELDRVYGIMQIFGDDFRVGKARVASETHTAGASHSFALLELEDELGALIVQRYTVISQLFQHDEPPVAGRAWRICGRASVPEGMTHPSRNFEESLRLKQKVSPKPECTLSTSMQSSEMWATFSGEVCLFDDLVSYTRSSDFVPPIEGALHVYLDAGLDYSELDEDDVESVIEYFGRESLMVLPLLSRTMGFETAYLERYGLMLLKPGLKALELHRTRRQWNSKIEATGLQAWSRVGICCWSFSTTPRDGTSMQVFIPDWEHLEWAEGIFG